jgi:hypothetical protein
MRRRLPVASLRRGPGDVPPALRLAWHMDVGHGTGTFMTASINTQLDHFLDCDLELDPDVDGAPCVIAGAGVTPDGACTVLPPGAGSGTGLRG